MQAQQSPDPTLALKLIWFAFLASQGMYLFVGQSPAFSAIASDEAKALAPDRVFLMALGTFAAANLVFSFILSKILAKSSLSHYHKRGGGQNPPLSRMPLADAVRVATTPYIVRLAMLEAIGIIGLAAAIVYRDFKLLYPFVGVAAAALAFNYPSEEKIRGILS